MAVAAPRPPLLYAHRNIVFGRDTDDAWALYRLEMRSYEGLTRADKQELLSIIAAVGYTVERDFSLVRVTRPWSVDAYATAAEALCDPRRGHPEAWRGFLETQKAELAYRRTARPEVYLSVRLAEPVGSPADEIAGLLQGARGDWRGALRRALSLGDPRGLSARQLAALEDQEAKTFARVADFLDADRASTVDLQWLIRRSHTRGLGDPQLDEHWRPEALLIEAPESDGHARYQPAGLEMLRLFDCPINVEPRSLVIQSELGESHQALLALGGLPEQLRFPDRTAELMFAPLEAVDFPVDARLACRFVANERALALARKAVQDADVSLREESVGDHGPMPNTLYRPQLARELVQYLDSGDRPPFLHGSISLAVGGGSRAELDDRVERLQREYGSVRLYRVRDEQLRLWISHLPAQPSGVREYDQYMSLEQLGSFVPIATHAVGTDRGPYVGYTLSGSRQPVLLDLTEPSRTDQPPAIAFFGTLGSGKSMSAQYVGYQAFLAGLRVVNVDPKTDEGVVDHHLDELAHQVDPEAVEVLELSGHEHFVGRLDPLQIAAADTREDFATSFLVDVLPDPVPANWRTEIRAAVQTIVAAEGSRPPTCLGVLEELERGSEDAQEAARALRVYASGGLSRLGFADPERTEQHRTRLAQLTTIRVRNLVLPLPGTTRADYSDDERIGQAVLGLLAEYAMHLTSDSRIPAVVLLDEAHTFLSDARGKRLLVRLTRYGRSQGTTPLLISQQVGDASGLENLIGACAVFGMRDDLEEAIKLLGLDHDDKDVRKRIAGYDAGRCMLRDWQGRVAPMQFDIVDPAIRATLETTARFEAGDDDAPLAEAA